jgi:hypothetical protein
LPGKAWLRDAHPRRCCCAEADVTSAIAHALWIGGATGAGKTTVARRLAQRWGLRIYSSDNWTWVHRDRAIAAGVGAAIAIGFSADEARSCGIPTIAMRAPLVVGRSGEPTSTVRL